MRRTPYESAAAPTSHSAADLAEFHVVCRSKSKNPKIDIFVCEMNVYGAILAKTYPGCQGVFFFVVK